VSTAALTTVDRVPPPQADVPVRIGQAGLDQGNVHRDRERLRIRSRDLGEEDGDEVGVRPSCNGRPRNIGPDEEGGMPKSDARARR
jgi:hypothetical protein